MLFVPLAARVSVPKSFRGGPAFGQGCSPEATYWTEAFTGVSLDFKHLGETVSISTGLAETANLPEKGVQEAFSRAPRLERGGFLGRCRLLAEAALEQLEFAVAEKAFVRFEDYQVALRVEDLPRAPQGIQLVKRLRLLDDRVKQKAEAWGSRALEGAVPGGCLLPALR